MQTLRTIDHFLNSHWEFSVLAAGVINYLVYRWGYRKGKLEGGAE
jgi:hypothetical protein